jgi:hypothetical protein
VDGVGAARREVERLGDEKAETSEVDGSASPDLKVLGVDVSRGDAVDERTDGGVVGGDHQVTVRAVPEDVAHGDACACLLLEGQNVQLCALSSFGDAEIANKI